jgi:tetratricopeptide (TPR) repeat protein
VALLAAVAAMAESREYENARRLLTDTIPRVKKAARLRVALADMLITLKRVDEAVEQLQTALAEEPDHPRALVLLGRIADQRGNAADARRFFRESIRLRPFDVESRLLLAQLLIAKGDDREAIEQYEQILRHQPRNTTALNNLAELLGRNDGELERAIDYARQAAVLSEDALILDTLGWLQFRAGKLDLAAKNLQRAALVLERNAIVQFHAGMAFARLKDSGDARRFLKRALAIDPKFAGAETARAELEKLP